MTNSKIIRELEKNKKGHIIFDNQKISDLNELKEILDKQDKIVVAFPYDEWEKVYDSIWSEDRYQRVLETRKYIATKILVELEKKYPQLKEYGASQDIKYFTSGNRELYQEKSHAMTIEDLEEIMSYEEIEVDRIHFIMNQTESDNLCDALSILLSDTTPFSVSFYSSPSKFSTLTIPEQKNTFIYEVYSYTRYREYEEGKENIVSKKVK